MDLYAGTPWWIIKNKLDNYHHPVDREFDIPVVVIGSGITGALVAHELCEAGIECCVIDKRSVSTGSSAASTALLQYEIDVPLYRMAEQTGEQAAVEAYHSCLDSIGGLKEIFRGIGFDPDFQWVPSLFLASNSKGEQLIKEELPMREKYGLPVEYLSRKEIKKRFGIRAPGALYNTVSAQIDVYKASTALFHYHMEKHRLPLYTHTEITAWKREKNGYRLTTRQGYRIRCEYLIVAAGFEAGPFLPRKKMQLTSTFALISAPVDPAILWEGRSLIWETREPYLYIRTDNRNRIIVGGEDIPFNSRIARKFLLERKAGVLQRKFKKLFPAIPMRPEWVWSGTFSSTQDGLPLIGAMNDNPNMLYALGYGGNGITFSVIAAQILSRRIRGIEDKREPIFSPERKSI